MKSKLTKFAQVAGIMLALTFTLSCSESLVNIATKEGGSNVGGIAVPKEAVFTHIGKFRTSTTRCEYESEGNTIKQVCYNDKGKVISRREYEYDSKGMIKSVFYYIDDRYIAMTGINEFEYDSKSNMIRHIGYDAEGNVSDRSEYKYDSKGNIIETVWYDKDDNATERMKYNCNIDGICAISGSIEEFIVEGERTYITINSKRLMKSEKYEHFDSLPSGKKITFGWKDDYEYDSNGNKTKITNYSLENGNYVKDFETICSYTY